MKHDHDDTIAMAAPDDSGYASDQEECTGYAPPESFESYLTGVFESDEEDDTSTSSKEMMPPPPRFKQSSSFSSCSDGSNTPPSGEGYVSGESDASQSCSPLTSSPALSDISSESDDDVWELKYLQKKRRLLMRACQVLKRDELYDASIAEQVATSVPLDTPLWKEAKDTLEELGIENANKRKKVASTIQGSSPGKRRRIDMTCVCHISTHADVLENLTPPTCQEKETKPVVVPKVRVAREDSISDDDTMDLEHAIAFTPVAQ